MSIFTNTGAKGFPKSLEVARKDIDAVAEGLKDGSLIEDNAIITSKIIDNAVTLPKLFQNGATPNSLANTNDFASAADGSITHLATASRERTVIIVAEVLEVFANGTGTQPTFEVGIDGDTTDLDRFFATSVFTDAAEGARFYAAGTIDADCELVITAVAGVGDGTGSVRFAAIAV